MTIIATDLDRTLLPNGKQAYDNSLPIFNKIIKENKFSLIYVTGRYLDQVWEARNKYQIPIPDHLIALVGTRLYRRQADKLIEDNDWIDEVNSQTKGWDIRKFQKALSMTELNIQEPEFQNQLKLSYYLNNTKNHKAVLQETGDKIKTICPDAVIIYSVDETRNLGLLDILPRAATKLAALEYLTKKLNLVKEDIVYCGDSGNDLLPLTHGYRAILVRNTIDEVKVQAQQITKENGWADKLYIARGLNKLNGNYVSGIIEGLIKFGIIGEEYSK
ncbi:MAG: HAD-IIB family hydrolase [Patescibacteria group bacterium]